MLGRFGLGLRIIWNDCNSDISTLVSHLNTQVQIHYLTSGLDNLLLLLTQSAISVHGLLCPPPGPPRGFWTLGKLLQQGHGPLALGTGGEVQEEGDERVDGALEPDPPIQSVATPLTHDQMLGPVTDTRGLHS